MKSTIRGWLGLDTREPDDGPRGALRALLDALDQLPPERARYLAQFAYLLGRVAHADQHVSAAETQTMERLIAREGGLPDEQAILVVGLAKASSLLFRGTEDFIVAREFASAATYDQKLALVRCLFAVSAAEHDISMDEEREIQRIARELRVEPSDVVSLRLEFWHHLPGLSKRDTR